MKKRVLSVLLIMALFVSCLAFSASAEGTPTLRLSSVSASRGDEVTVDVIMENNPGVTGIDVKISYDKTRLKLTGFSNGCLSGWVVSVEAGGAIWADSVSHTENSVILTLKFEVLVDAPLGDAVVQLTNPDIIDDDLNTVDFKFESGSVTVTCDHEWDAGVITKKPTCTDDGIKTFTCKKCNTTREETITHEGHKSDAGTITTEPTCTETGVKTYKCTVCGEVLMTETVPANGHSWGDWVLTTEPTLDADGVETRTCQTCGATETRPVAAVVYTVSYNANGGSGAPESQRKLQGAALTLSETVPTRDGFIFKGWAESAGEAEAQYQPGGSFTADADTTLYAVWEKDASYVGAITVGTITRARPGTEVTVPISLTENPGITGIGMKIEYDKTRLQLTGYSDAGLTGWVVGVGTGEKAVWGDAVGSTITGDILTLTFTVLEGAEDGLAEITVTELDITDLDVNNVDFSVTSGGVTVANSIPGDVNGDGRVAIADVVTLKRYLAGMDVEIDPVAADVNGDGKQTIADVVLIMRYLAGMDVVLK